MAAIDTRRMTARMDGEFVVFLIGMRVNRWWKVASWWPVFTAMPRMIAELEQHPEDGFLGCHMYLGHPTLMVQYWRSVEQLNAFATKTDRAHRPAWAAFNRRIGNNGDVGIWHETYRVRPGDYESVYHNMPPFGLGRVGRLEPAEGALATADGRMTSG